MGTTTKVRFLKAKFSVGIEDLKLRQEGTLFGGEEPPTEYY